jgi:uncharacterized protein YjcR|tara:strand:- start:469 stop:687 length:219 start_codon:yes stop_codon:yes gene_type:complete
MTDKLEFDYSKKKYVDSSTIAEYFGVSPSTVRLWVKEERIPRSTYIRAGRETIRYDLASIEAHLTQGEQNGE